MQRVDIVRSIPRRHCLKVHFQRRRRTRLLLRVLGCFRLSLGQGSCRRVVRFDKCLFWRRELSQLSTAVSLKTGKITNYFKTYSSSGTSGSRQLEIILDSSSDFLGGRVIEIPRVTLTCLRIYSKIYRNLFTR